MAEGRTGRKPLHWVGSSLRDTIGMPDEVKRVVGFALHEAQCGRKHQDAKPLRGFRGAGVLEVVVDEGGDTFRAVYTVRLPRAVYVLHVFQKKSKQGVKTPQHDIDLVRRRLADAVQHHREHYEAQQHQEQSDEG